MAIKTLKKRSEFLRLRGGARWATPSFVLETKSRPAEEAHVAGPRFGFTVTKKLGGAVRRNRIKRRLRAALSGLVDRAHMQHDYVLVARAQAYDRPFSDIERDLAQALTRVHEPRRARSRQRK